MGRQVSLHQCESVHLEQGSLNKLRGYVRPAPFGNAPSTRSLLDLLLTKQNDVGSCSAPTLPGYRIPCELCVE